MENGDDDIETMLAERPAERGPGGRLRLGSSFGGWRIEAFLGAGRSAEVYRAVNAKTGRDGALKLLADRSPGMRRRFDREIEALGSLSIPAAPRLLAKGEADGVPFLVVEYLQPLFLPLDRRDALPFLRALAAAVRDLHAAGWIHRDIKPANILLRKNGEPVLVDFGLARRTGEADGRDGDGRRYAVGTPGFAAPEQLVEGRSDERSDVYSLGKMVRAAYPGRIPGRVLAVARKATSDDPSERQQSADAFLRELCARNWRAPAAIAGGIAAALAVAAVAIAVAGGRGRDTAPKYREVRLPRVAESAQTAAAGLEKRPDETDEAYFARVFELGAAGDAMAQTQVAEAYFYGRGVATNLEESVKWYGRAAAAGIPGAQASMGLCKLRGYGCERDAGAAATWFASAAEAGHAGAMNDLAFCYLNGIGVERDDSMGFAWAMLSAKRGHPAAQTTVGECYLTGRGTPQDMEKARFWLEKSASAGNRRAAMLLKAHQ